MEHKKTDLHAVRRAEIARVMRLTAHYCRSQRLIQVDVSGLPLETTEEIGNQVVDLFLDLHGQAVKNTPAGRRKHGAETPMRVLERNHEP